ncbi:MAG TPA: DUF4294 domain-containing protein [Chitinophagaceae bacterium]|nr:DUF4294 domain-containing protein [Chitinophagaceae bacterium]
MTKWIFILVLLFSCCKGYSQRGPNDTIRVGTIIIGKDTFIHKWLNEVYIIEKAPKWYVKKLRKEREEREAYSRLRYNVYLVYPYAVAASFILKDVDSVLNSLNSKVAKQQFKRRKEDELNKKFKHELQNLSISQGQVLVKLIARQTGRPCYAIVKELKGGFNASIFQAMALLFDNNLKNNYDPLVEDAAIEQIVNEIESSGHFIPKK